VSSGVTFAAGVAEIACGAGLHGAPAEAVTGPPAGITGVPSNGNVAGSLASRSMIGPNFSSSDDDEDDDPVVGFGVWTGRTGLVLRGPRIGSDREAAVGPVVPPGAPDEESVGAVVVVGAAGPVAGAGLGAAGVGASSSMGTPSCRAFSAAVRTSDRSSTDAMTTTGAELNSVAETPAATASGVWPPSTVVQSFGSWTPAALPPESPPAAGLVPPCPQAASVSVAAVSTPRERSRVSRRARVEDATEPPQCWFVIFDRQATFELPQRAGNLPSAMPCQDLCVNASFPDPRVATADDIPELVALIESAYRGESSRIGWTTEADLLSGQRLDAVMLAEELADPTFRMFVVPDAEGPLACAAVTDRGRGTAYFGMFAVRPNAQGGGIGSWLLARAEEHARSLGARRMEMTVLWMRTDLIAWYARRGYVPTGDRVPFPAGDPRFGLPLRPDLAFVVLAAQLTP
jgi:GNAT superfamily N-acetyltransferase